MRFFIWTAWFLALTLVTFFFIIIENQIAAGGGGGGGGGGQNKRIGLPNLELDGMWVMKSTISHNGNELKVTDWSTPHSTALVLINFGSDSYWINAPVWVSMFI